MIIFIALLCALLIGLVVGAVVGFVLGYDKAVVDNSKQPRDMRVEVVTPTKEEMERLRKYYDAWKEDIDDQEG